MENKLSASKIKTAQSCSWKYWCSYHLKLPQKGNDGSSRGWICHLIFELLGSKRHHHHYKKIIKSGSIFSSKSITKLVHYHAKKLNVFDQENLDLIAAFFGIKKFFSDSSKYTDRRELLISAICGGSIKLVARIMRKTDSKYMTEYTLRKVRAVCIPNKEMTDFIERRYGLQFV